ncbi:[protein-PII] uridylyltransferase [Streptomyces aculeolatus]|uniref:[protein-PII] uridylyltransferase n=1 Tax=Streptomyces aculeolatus TaxID=270689 RepID=UPI001CEC65CE|nr:[protein-PII] uridylyltransferase [Streptomyces aculeolatus]
MPASAARAGAGTPGGSRQVPGADTATGGPAAEGLAGAATPEGTGPAAAGTRPDGPVAGRSAGGAAAAGSVPPDGPHGGEPAGPAAYSVPEAGDPDAPLAEEAYAAARVRLLGAEGGAARRAALARATDRWLAGLLHGATGGAPGANEREPGPSGGVRGPLPPAGDGAHHESGDARRIRGAADARDARRTLAPGDVRGPRGTRGVALVAVGGYGRGELSPRSDLDLLLLHDGSLKPAALAALADRLWYPVWDMGLALDHSVRTPAEALKTAGDDLKVTLGLLDARHVAGDAALTSALRTAVFADWRNRAARRLPELRELGCERAERHGELQFLLEPDLKEARGGLRDATALRAVAASWLADAPREGLDRARVRLLDTRDVLHLTTGRATDRLALQEQDQVAAALGLLDADTLLREVYEAARTLAYATDVTWREVDRVLRARGGRRGAARLRSLIGSGQRGPAARTPLADGVVEQDGEVVLARTARPARDPVLPLRAAAAAAQAGLPLSLHAVRLLAAQAPPLPVPWPDEAREQLVTLLGAGEATVPVWESLEAEGFITRLLPDWERVRCRPQRNAVHRWTVDRHLVESAVRAAALTRRVGRPDLLLVAALLHDIGKGWPDGPGGHSATGETIARDMARRIGFPPADAGVLAALVRHHLLLVETATRRDLDDPATVRLVADAVGDRGTLELLHALTEADALATGPAAWSAWRASLVADLARRVDAALAGGPAGAAAGERPGRTPGAAEERLAVEAWRTRAPALTMRARTEQPPPAAGEPAAAGAAAGEASGAAGTEQGGTLPLGVELLVAVPDRPDALAALAGVLALHRLTVRTAELRPLRLPPGVAGESAVPATEAGAPDTANTTAPAAPAPGSPAPDRSEPAADGPDGPDDAAVPHVLLLTWRVAAEFGSLPAADRLRADLVRVLDGTLDVPARLAEREKAYRPRRRAAPAPPPRVAVAHGSSRFATVIEVRAQDAPGLLHRIGRALEAPGVRVRGAYVSTLGANAVDAFYVTDPAGRPLADRDAEELARRLQSALV